MAKEKKWVRCGHKTMTGAVCWARRGHSGDHKPVAIRRKAVQRRNPSCFYGKRLAVYVHIEYPDHKTAGGQKHLSVYGRPLNQVIRVVDRALREAFGKTEVGRAPGRPRKKLKK